MTLGWKVAMLVKRIASILASLTVTVLASGCAVGPDFVHPAAPEVGRYTREPMASRTSSAHRRIGTR